MIAFAPDIVIQYIGGNDIEVNDDDPELFVERDFASDRVYFQYDSYKMLASHLCETADAYAFSQDCSDCDRQGCDNGCTVRHRSAICNQNQPNKSKTVCCGFALKGNIRRLTSNFGLALNRLKQQCVKFGKDIQCLEQYQKILKDQEDRRFIERVEYFKTEEDCHFLAHHGVKKDSATTPIRIVFNCSVRRGSGLSLNNCLWTGPHITADLFRVLLQLKTKLFACISDIEKTFLMVQLREEDRDYTRFLWLEDPTEPTSKLLVYRF
ncbi:uncharacterized protein [Macrobrachium rosenbergii]|uniref:uncharacterized protein n=1 Tax=Macrobrachium rosenbergii TaxID=79674 RepID=UPI0034D6006D